MNVGYGTSAERAVQPGQFTPGLAIPWQPGLQRTAAAAATASPAADRWIWPASHAIATLSSPSAIFRNGAFAEPSTGPTAAKHPNIAGDSASACSSLPASAAASLYRSACSLTRLPVLVQRHPGRLGRFAREETLVTVRLAQ